MTTKTNKTATKNATPTGVSIASTLFNLQSEAQQWNLNEFKKANDMLYAMLKTCLVETRKLRKLTSSQITIFDEQLEERQIKFNKGTALETKVIRAVFEIDAVKDKRASKYARVLKIAKADAIEPEVFVAWLNEQNGIDNVGRQDNADLKAKEKQGKLDKAHSSALTIEAKDFSEAVECESNYTRLSVALLRHAGSEVVPIAFSNNTATIAKLLNELAKQLNAEEQTEERRSDTKKVTKIKNEVRKSQSTLEAAA